MQKSNNNLVRFEQCVLPHLDAAFNLARWLVGNRDDAQDLVQESCLRALKYFNSFHGVDARSWLLTIVRNTSYTWLQRYRAAEIHVAFEDESFDPLIDTCESMSETNHMSTPNPEAQLMQEADDAFLKQSIEKLPVEFREVIVLRELEELSYKQIAAITGVPVGTIMSRLARARKRLQQVLAPSVATTAHKDLPNGL